MSIGTGIRIHSFNQPVTTAFYYINRPNVALTTPNRGSNNNNKSCLQINLDVREKVQSIAKTAKKKTRERTFFFFLLPQKAQNTKAKKKQKLKVKRVEKVWKLSEQCARVFRKIHSKIKRAQFHLFSFLSAYISISLLLLLFFALLLQFICACFCLTACKFCGFCFVRHIALFCPCNVLLLSVGCLGCLGVRRQNN